MARKIVRFIYKGQRFELPKAAAVDGGLDELLSSLSSMAEQLEALANCLSEAEQKIEEKPKPSFFVMTKDEYDALEHHERNVPYFIIEPETKKFWRIGDPLPAIVGDYGLVIGDPLPIIIGGKDYL